jgi:threonine dehydrogenase-like Zn-dependent dehydrogenase
VVVEPAAERAALARRLGASEVVDPRTGDARAAVLELSHGLGADAVVDAVGSQLPAALMLVRRAGRIVLFGIDQQARAPLAQFEITRNEVTVLGSFVGQEVFPTAIRLLEQGRIDFEALVTHRIPLDGLPAAVEELRCGRAVKVEVELAR